ncbi:redoxin family protein [Bacteroidales bacterium]|nr:redoxin family protein [Bacteroidales bacterium]
MNPIKTKTTHLIILSLLLILNGCNWSNDEIPESIIGHYYHVSSGNYWEYSIQNDFMVFDQQFWDIKKIRNSSNHTKLHVESGGHKNIVKINRLDSLTYEIEIDKNKQTYTTDPKQAKRTAINAPISFEPGETTILGFIADYQKYKKDFKSIEFLYNNPITINTNRVFADIDSMGRFWLNMHLISAQDIMYKLNTNKLHWVFVAPNDTIMLFLDPENYLNTECQGNVSDINYDIRDTRNQRDNVFSFKEDNRQLGNRFREYKAYRDDVRKKQLELLHEYAKNKYCSETFKIWYNTEIEYEYFNFLKRYNWKTFSVMGRPESFNAHKAFLNEYIKNMVVDDSTASISGQYFFYLFAISYGVLKDKKEISSNIYKDLNNRSSQLTKHEKDSIYYRAFLSYALNTLKGIQQPRLKDIEIAQLVSSCIMGRKVDHLDYTFDLVKNEIKNDWVLNEISDYVAEFRKKENDFRNINIKLSKSNDSGSKLFKSILDENKGKVMVLDFWFTGCGACRKDFKHIGKFKNELATHLDVQFVYLCYSSSIENWKYVAKEYNLKGQNYLLNQKQMRYFNELFTISSAPRYILINKAGKIVNSNFHAPMYKDGYITAVKNALHN